MPLENSYIRVRENAEFSDGTWTRDMNEAIWLLAIPLSMLLGVLAFAFLTGFVPYSSPAEVIKTFYSACDSGNLSLAEKLLEPEANRELTRPIGAADGGLRGICDEETKQGHLQKVEILHEEVHGDIAQVRYVLHYADGSATEETQGLVVKHWVWKISP